MKKIYLALFFVLSLSHTFSQNCSLNAGANYTICQSQVMVLDGQSGGVLNPTPNYQWVKLFGPGATITSPGTLQTTVTNFGIGTYLFELSGDCNIGGRTRDQVQITVIPDVTIPQAGPDQQRCTTGSTTLNANTPAAGETGTWILSGTAGVNAGTNTFTTPDLPATTFNYSTGGVKQAIWRISNGSCSKDDTVNINVVAPATISAGPDRTISCLGSSITLAGSNPGLSPQLGTWSVVSGPSGSAFGNINLSNSSFGNLTPGVYTLRWSVTGPCATSSDDVVITVSNINPNPNLGTDVNYTQFCNSSSVSQLVLTDNNLQPGQTGLWTYVSGPVGSSFTTPNNNTTLVTGLDGNSNYVFRYTATITATGCTDDALHNVFFQRPITGITAPASVVLPCGVNTTVISTTYAGALTTTGLTRTLTFVSGPQAVPASTITRSGGLGTDAWTITRLDTRGTYTFRLQYTNACTSEFRTIQVFVSATPPESNAGSDQLLPCNQLFANLVGSNEGAGNSGTWSQISGPNTATIVAPNNRSTLANGLTTGVYFFRWTINGGPSCPTRQDDIRITVSSPTVVPANAGLDESVCALTPVKLKGNTPGVTQTGTWTVSPSTGVIFTDTNNPGTSVTGLQPNTTYTFMWTISNACSSSTDNVIFTTNGNSIPVIINAGTDQCLAAGTTTISLLGNTPAANETTIWTALDGGIINNPSSPTTTVTVPGNGTYRFVYELTRNGCGPTTDTVMFTISNPTSAAAAGADQNICSATIPASGILFATSPTAGIGNWSLVAGNGSATIGTPNSSSTTIGNLAEGSYVFRYTITNGACASNFDDVQVNIGQQPTTAAAGADQSLCSYTNGNITLAANTPTIGTGVWTVLSGPAGVATPPAFANALSPTTTVNGFQNGVYILRWTVSNGSVCPASFDDLEISISVTANASSTANALCNATVATLTGNANATGTWTTNASPVPPSTPTINPLTGNTALATNLVPGAYSFRFTIPALGSCPATFSDRTVTISTLPTPANAGADETLCAGVTSAVLTGTPNTGSRRWSFVSGPSTIGTFANNTNPVTATPLVGGVYEFAYTTSSGACTSVDTKLVIAESLANAGRDTALCNATSFQLKGNAPAFNTASWTQVSGPNTATFNDANLTSPTISNLTTGTYIFRYTYTGAPGCPANFDEVTITNSPTVTASAGPNITQCVTATSPTLGTTPQPGVIYQWTPASNLSDAGIAQPIFTGTTAGTYNYNLIASNQGCSASSSVSVVLVDAPLAPITDASPALCGSSTQLVTITNASFGTTYTWSGGLGTGISKTVGVGSYTITASNGFCNPANSSFTIVPLIDFGDLATAKWPVASAGIASCLITNNVPNNYNAGTNPNVVVWAGDRISIESQTISGGNNQATTDNFDDGLIFPAGAINAGYSYPFGIRLNANISGTTVYYRIWFDWNDDGNFANDLDGNGNSATYSGSAVRNAAAVVSNFSVKPPVGGLASYKVRVAVSDQPIADVYRVNGSNYVLQITNGEIEDYAAVTILPVTGFVLTGHLNNGKPSLLFTTLTEANTDYLEIQRSADGATFKAIYKTKTAGTSVTQQTYRYNDNELLPGKVYYRVKMTDKDGFVSFSNTVVLSTPASGAVIAFPNPVKNILTVKHYGTKAILELMDVTGKRLWQKWIGTGTTQIDMSHFASGSYMLQITDSNGIVYNKKIVKAEIQ